jgi:hypothetical protein
MLGDYALEDLLALDWREHAANPLIRAPFPSPIIADPAVVPPAESPDGRWHLFAHSLLGIHHFTSDDGIRWSRRRGVVVRSALRASLFRDRGRYSLLYERTRLFLPMVPWSSWIEVRTSEDLERWSAPRVLLRPSLPWHARGRSRAVGNPCLVAHGGGYRLYYSAGLVRLVDCGFDEPRHVGVADGPTPLGPFTPHAEPPLSPHADDPFANLGAGALKVFRAADGFLGLQNGIYRDVGGASRSAVRLLGSSDGVCFTVLGEPFVRPTTGWRRSHVYAVDLCRVGDVLHLYFNARDDWHWTRGREAIGLVTASAPRRVGR